jgi:hypothetical protein
MMPTPEAREGEKELRGAYSKVWQVMRMSDLYEFDSDYDEMLDAYRTAVRAALVAEMVAGVRDLEWEYRDGIPVRYLQREQVLTYLHGLAPETDPNG